MQMDWYTKRKTVYVGVLVVFILGSIFYLSKDIIFPAPRCDDGKQNGIEVGVDCGGGCLMVCKSEYKPLVVSLEKAIPTAPGTYDILILIDNPNKNSAPKMLTVIVDLYDKDGKKFKTLKSDSPAFTGSQIPVFNQNFKAENISNVIARIEPYEMYKSNGGYDMQLKKFTYTKTSSGTNMDIFYKSPYMDDITETFYTMVLAYNSLGNIVGFTESAIKGLKHDTVSELFVTLPYRVEGEIASVKFVPLNIMYAKDIQ